MDTQQFAREMVRRCRDEIVQVMTDMIRLPSENKPPTGSEKQVQQYQADYLRQAGIPVELYQPDQVPGLREHPEYWPGRDYTDRPNLSSTLPGRGGGRSLLLTGHCDTVALGENRWNHPPFGARIHEGRMYGLGASDMKGQMAAMLVMYKTLAASRVPLLGALSYECVVDEEEAGVNSTIAGRLRDGPRDAAIIPEATGLDVYPAVRGALISQFTFQAEGTWLEVGKQRKQLDAVEQIGLFLTHLDDLRGRLREWPVPDIYAMYPEPRPVNVTKIYAGGWGSEVPIAVPASGRIELIIQTVPGDERPRVLQVVEEWLAELVRAHPTSFIAPPTLEFARRWMHPSEMAASHTFVTFLRDSVIRATGRPPAVKGAPYPCDLWALQRLFHMPSVVFGPAGGNSHAADEYVEMESVFEFVESLIVFVLEWCGVAEG
jgi:acetylornithine deacetylase